MIEFRVTVFGLTILLAGLSLPVTRAEALCLYSGKHFTKTNEHIKAAESAMGLYAKTTIEDEFSDSALVISGVVLAKNDVAIPGPDQDDGVVSRLKVTRFFKGKRASVVSYYSAYNSGGFYLDVGKEYLLFLNPNNPSKWEKRVSEVRRAMIINYSCGQSRPWAEVPAKDRATLQALAAGKR